MGTLCVCSWCKARRKVGFHAHRVLTLRDPCVPSHAPLHYKPLVARFETMAGQGGAGQDKSKAKNGPACLLQVQPDIAVQHGGVVLALGETKPRRSTTSGFCDALRSCACVGGLVCEPINRAPGGLLLQS